jgi:hypothetical protein
VVLPGPPAARPQEHGALISGRQSLPAPRSRRRKIAIAAGAILVLFLIVGALLALRYVPYLDRAHAALGTARAIEQRVSTLQIDAVDAAFVAQLREEVNGLRADLVSLQGVLATDPLVGLARNVSATGDRLRAADHVSEAAGHLLDAADAGLALADRFITVRAAPPDAVLPGLIGLMATAAPDLGRIQASIDSADQALDAAGPGADGKIGEAANMMRTAIARYRPLLGQYASIDDLIPGLFGWGGERRYLVLAVDPAELRPGGGYTGTVGVVSFADGRLGEHTFVDVYSLDLKGGVPFVEPPEGLANHLLGSATWQLADANWSPDYPTSAQDALRLYTLESGDANIDGVITVTTYALDRILEAIGPIEVPEYGVTLHAGEVTLTTLAQTRGTTGSLEERKAFLNRVADILLTRLQQLPPAQWLPLFKALEDIAARRDVLVWTDDPQAQVVLGAQPIGGAIRRDAGDYLYVVESNVAPTSKYNLVVHRSTELDVALDPSGSATDVLRLRWQNDSGKEGEPYASIRAWSTSSAGVYGAYLRVLVPTDTELIDVHGTSGDPITREEDVVPEAGTTAITNFLPMPPGPSELVYTWQARAVAQQTGNDWLYRLTIQKQPGTLSEPVTVRVTLPTGASLVSAPEGASTSGNMIVVSRSVDTDLQLDVRYTLP